MAGPRKKVKKLIAKATAKKAAAIIDRVKPTKAMQRHKAKPPTTNRERIQAMTTEIDDLREQIDELQKENDQLKERNEELENSAEATTAQTPRVKWVRGKLPGEKLIKTNPETGAFEEIDKQEWDLLA
jgi:TolA-binding protein